jgi:hypothetical protein
MKFLLSFEDDIFIHTTSYKPLPSGNGLGAEKLLSSLGLILPIDKFSPCTEASKKGCDLITPRGDG